ncbi:MAG TPA: hypothetical protein VFF30_02920 [Nitrososphaerales archaeon]|nr:hypothetical protein [Nitrososphaerales archaeon]
MQNHTKNNIIASAVDIASILFAYRLGLAELGIGAGLAYGMFDAWLVVWQRERIAEGMRRIEEVVRRRKGVFRRKDILPWAANN